MSLRSNGPKFVALTTMLIVSTDMWAQLRSMSLAPVNRTLAGIVINDRSEAVVGVTVTAQWKSGRCSETTDAQGAFSLSAPAVAVRLTVTGRFIAANETTVSGDAESPNLEL